jgi:hypothetical protein
VKPFAETFHNELKGTGVSSLKTTVTAS